MLHYNTVTPTLRKILEHLMTVQEFSKFNLVGGTSLSLQKGHRESVDIDLFTEAAYKSIDFKNIDSFLRKQYAYVDAYTDQEIGMGISYYIGDSSTNSVKLDLYYTEPFIRAFKEIDGIRLASVEDIIAMKLEVISQGGRKKDFWDIHELIHDFSIDQMVGFHKERYPHGHDTAAIISGFKNFEIADGELDPKCLRHKYWEVIKLDMIAFAG